MEKRRLPLLVLGAIGVVFGDIGTSPLYTLKACFDFSGASAHSQADILGIASLLIWALVLVVCLKYVTFIMRIDHDGEGGILALLARANPPAGNAPVRFGIVTLIVIVGAAMLLGDGAITPAISVVSAIEGLDVASPALHSLVVPISAGILIALFVLQTRGTERVGRIFGPIMVVWFLTIAVAGALGIASNPFILAALNPAHAVTFIFTHHAGGLLVFGGVVLAMTGVEALYADLSHFGYGAIVRGWYCLVFPSLVLCYLGEAARVATSAPSLGNPFYALWPGWLLYPAIVIATIATIIASQALISGAFTLAEQAISLGLWPRMKVVHTSADFRGQVFVAGVNVTLACACIALVLAFQSSDRLASAFGLAVSATMLATSVAYYEVVRHALKWPLSWCVALLVSFVVIDSTFIVAGLPKFIDGGWVPFAVAWILSTCSVVWLRGRRRVFEVIALESAPISEVVSSLKPEASPEHPVMVFLSHDRDRVPFFANHRWIRERAREERIVLLTLVRGDGPYVRAAHRITVTRYSARVVQISAAFGYMEPPRIEPVIEAARAEGIDLARADTSYFYADPKLEDRGGFAFERRLFVALTRLARPLPDDLQIPAIARIEIGLSVPC